MKGPNLCLNDLFGLFLISPKSVFNTITSSELSVGGESLGIVMYQTKSI